MTASGIRPEAAQRGYHHGKLVDALIAAAVEVIAAEGVENLSLRAVSKRVGVSPGAPFRHFKSKAELLTAVAEQSMSRLTSAVEAELAQCENPDPVAKLHAVGRGYLRWALGNPTHFQIISSRTLIDFHGSESLVAQNEAIRLLLLDIVAEGQAQGRIRRDSSPHELVIDARAFAYGLARMAVDGHFREWAITGNPEVETDAALTRYVRMLATGDGGVLG
jgi:AcrR family transcriptional regulator